MPHSMWMLLNSQIQHSIWIRLSVHRGHFVELCVRFLDQGISETNIFTSGAATSTSLSSTICQQSEHMFCRHCQHPSSETQWWFRSLHQPLGQSARKALNLPSKINTKLYSVWSNQITALLSPSCKDRFHWPSCASEHEDDASAVNRRKFN